MKGPVLPEVGIQGQKQSEFPAQPIIPQMNFPDVSFQLECRQIGGEAVVKLEWKARSATQRHRQVIPSSNLYFDMSTLLQHYKNSAERCELAD